MIAALHFSWYGSPAWNVARHIVLGYNALVFFYVVFVDLTYLLFTFIALIEVRRYLRTRDKERLEQIFRSRLVPPISILCPAHNEGATIVESVRSLLRLKYSKHEVVVINDGSKDNTLAAMIEAFSMERLDFGYDMTVACKPVKALYASAAYPKLIVVDKENGGKADALNAGINVSRYPLFCTVDADAILEEDALLHVVRPMLDRPTFVPITGGIIRAANGCRVVKGRVEAVGLPRKPIELFQIVEYMRAFLCGRTAQSTLNVMLIVSGAFGLFHKATAKTVGGYSSDTVGEDKELVVKIVRYLKENKRDYEVLFVPQTVCWTEVPSSWQTLGRQRNRWHRGMFEVLYKHRAMFFNRAYGRAGLFGMPYFLLIEAIGPVVELSGYILLPLAAILGLLAPINALIYTLCAVVLGIILSVSAVLLEEASFHRYPRWRDLAVLNLIAIAENFGYRQLTLWWRLKGTWDYVRGQKQWGAQVRQGFGTAAQHAEAKAG
ncbi:MAG TPA: glycosyltransferase [Candidatus Eremiobacteraceae bacterium]|nr:glycosyltransferase [Candidatus Eremiobacteraceae bacterium]